MLKPEYLFLWILFHIAAVEVPNFIQKSSAPPTHVAELYKDEQFVKAISTFDSSKHVRYAHELRAYVSSLMVLRENEEAFKFLKIQSGRYSSKITKEDRIREIQLLRRLGKYQVADSVTLASRGALNLLYAFPQGNDTLTLFTDSSSSFIKNICVDTTSVFGLFYSMDDKGWYYNKREKVRSGILSSKDIKTGDYFTKIYFFKGKTFKDSGEKLIGQYVDRDVEFSDLDAHNNIIFSTNNKIVNDSDEFCLNIKQRYFDKTYGKFKDRYIIGNDIQSNYSSFKFNNDFSRALFVSDFYGGYGKGDIYIADVNYNQEDSTTFKLSNYINLGESVNTGLNESDPVFITDDLIAFCTEGRSGYGDRDVYFYSIGNNISINAGPEINSKSMEYGLSFTNDRLYWSVKGLKDSENEVLKNCKLHYPNIYQRMKWVMNNVNSENGADYFIDYIEPIADIQKENKTPTNYELSNNFDPSIDTIVKIKIIRDTIKIEPQTSYYDTFRTQNLVADATFLYTDEATRLNLAKEVNENSDYKDFHFFDIYFPEKSIRFESHSEFELILAAEILKRRTDWGIEVRSHTDYTGTESSNKELSESRSYSVKKYLVGRGISKSRIRSIGFGESFPKNHCREGVTCTEKEMRENRRTELVIFPMN